MEVAIMRVVFGVAGIAAGLEIIEDFCFVTVFAIIVCMLAQERECRKVVVKEQRVFPVHLCMAVLALRTQRALVRVIVQVTGVTSRHQFDFEYRFDVAIIARDLKMSAQQFVVGIPVVIKQHVRPVVIAMASVALDAVMAFMLVVLEVT